MNSTQKILIILFSILSLMGCSKNPGAPEYQKEVTVFGYLWGNEPVSEEHAILIAYTQPITDFYDLDKAAIQDANVTLTESGTGNVFTLREKTGRPGYYFNDSVMVLPKETYHLNIKVDGKSITASTKVPPMLHLTTDLKSDSVNYFYQKNVSKTYPVFMECESVEQIILVDMYCNESFENAEYINPFFNQNYPSSREEYDGGVDGEPRHIMGMARLREMTSHDFPDRYVVDWYSSMIVFYGSNTMQVLAIDDNYHNFIFKEYPERNGGINGGIGVFGSVCGEDYELMVLKP